MVIKKPVLSVESISESFKRMIFELEDYFFEKIHSLDLNGIIKNEALNSNHKHSLPHATAYQAVWSRNLREIFLETRKTGYKFENFIDVGSGKGKACFYAQFKKEFNNVIGIEFSKTLIDIANRNKEKNFSKNTNFIHTDATEYILPDQPSLVFLFNPFDSIVLGKFVTNNIKHFRKHKSIIAYANDTERLCLNKIGFETIFRNQTRRISLFQIS